MKSIILFILVLFSTAICFAAQSNYTESLTISTYYPAPYGVYRDLQARKSFAVGNYSASEVQSLNSGDIRTSGVIIVGNGTTNVPGAIRFNDTSASFEGYSGSSWKPLGGSEGNPLVNSFHTQGQCTANHGELISISGAAYPFCRINATECPSGWNQYLHWSTTVAGQQVPDLPAVTCLSRSCPNKCTGAILKWSHIWSDSPQETLKYCDVMGWDMSSPSCCMLSGDPNPGTSTGCNQGNDLNGHYEMYNGCGDKASATVTQIGCY